MERKIAKSESESKTSNSSVATLAVVVVEANSSYSQQEVPMEAYDPGYASDINEDDSVFNNLIPRIKGLILCQN